MSEFTKGKWEIEGTVPFGIKSEASSRIAIVLKLSDARLIAAAPEMYKLLYSLGYGEFDATLHAILATKAKELITRIDSEEAQPEIPHLGGYFGHRRIQNAQ